MQLNPLRIDILKLLDDSLSEEDRSVVLDQIAQDPELVDMLVQLTVVDDLLRQQSNQQCREGQGEWLRNSLDRSSVAIHSNVAAPPRTLSSIRSKRAMAGGSSRVTFWGITGAILASLLLLVGNWSASWTAALLHQLEANVPPEQSEKLLPAFVEMSRSANVQWPATANRWSVGDRLRIGDTIHLDAGRVELTFDTGTVLVLAGPAELELRSADLVKLRSGTATTRVSPAQAHKFRILTPTTDVLDLGTEFGVRVNPTGGTDVAVFDGAIDVTPKFTANQTETYARRLGAGEAARVNQEGAWERIVAIESSEFPFGEGLFPRSPSRPPVILSVDDDRRDPSSQMFYQIYPEGLQEDCRAYVDRIYEWNGLNRDGLPGFLRGADYVATFNDDKYGGPLITLELSGPATLYVIYDVRLTVPEWLRQNFEDTGVQIGMDSEGLQHYPDGVSLEVALGRGAGNSIDRPFAVWRREIERAGPVHLGQLGTRKEFEYGEAMFGIAAQPR